MQDKKLVCKDCGNVFIWSIEEQRWYEAKDFSEPKRCRACRQIRREEKNR